MTSSEVVIIWSYKGRAVALAKRITPPKGDPISVRQRFLNLSQHNIQYIQNVQTIEPADLAAQGRAEAREIAHRAEMQAGGSIELAACKNAPGGCNGCN